MNARLLAIYAALGALAWALFRPRSASASMAAPGQPLTLRQGADGVFSLPGMLPLFSSARAAMWTPPKAAAPYLPAIRAAEDAAGIPRNLLARLLQQESAYRSDVISGQTRSRTGAIGIAQILPSTAKQPGYGVAPVNPFDAYDSIRFAGQYLAAMYARTRAWSSALAAYNQGLGAVLGKAPTQWPAEGRMYAAAIATDMGLA